MTAPLKASLKRGLRTADPVLRWLVAHVVRPLLPHVARLPRRRREGGRTRVTILILNAYGMGGTIRTAFNLASYLSEQYDVEVLSVKRRKREPFFAFPPGVKVTALDDTFDRGGAGPAAGATRPGGLPELAGQRRRTGATRSSRCGPTC